MTHTDYSKGRHYKIFEITGSSSVSFTIDTAAPTIAVLSPQNKTYASPDVQLNFAANETGLQFRYSLDGQKSETIAKNITLTGLPTGHHNLTVCAKDEAGNTGTIETVYFNITEPFPTTFVATASGTSIAVIGLLVYFKKHKH